MKKEAILEGALCVVECVVFGLATISLVVGALFGLSGDILSSGAEYIRSSREGKEEETFLNRLKNFKVKFDPAVNSFKAATAFSSCFNGRSVAPTAEDKDDLASDSEPEKESIFSEDDPEELGAENGKAANNSDGRISYARDNCC